MSIVWKKAVCVLLCAVASPVFAGETQTPAPAGVTAAPAAPTQQANSPDAIFARWDKDKNNALSPDEFKAGWQEVLMAAAVRKLHDNFVAMDGNRSGGLEANEYANLELIKKAGKSAPPISTFDTDKNQRLDFKEYVGMVNAMLQKKP